MQALEFKNSFANVKIPHQELVIHEPKFSVNFTEDKFGKLNAMIKLNPETAATLSKWEYELEQTVFEADDKELSFTVKKPSQTYTLQVRPGFPIAVIKDGKFDCSLGEADNINAYLYGVKKLVLTVGAYMREADSGKIAGHYFRLNRIEK